MDRLRTVLGFALIGLALGNSFLIARSAQAADTKPGEDFTCESDASGKHFACRKIEPGDSGEVFQRVLTTPDADVPVAPDKPVGEVPAYSQSQSARDVPNYLRTAPAQKSPAAARPVETTRPAPSAVAKSTEDANTPSQSNDWVRTPAPPPRGTTAEVQTANAQSTRQSTPEPVSVPQRAAPIAATPAPSPPPPAIATPAPLPAAVAPIVMRTAPPPRRVAETPPASHAVETPAPQPAPIAQAPRTPATPPLSSAEFRALDPGNYTLEIAHAPSRDDLLALAADLSLEGSVYLLHMRSGAEPWVLMWSDFSGIASARDARAQLPADARINSGWPRRIGPLQGALSND
ncbi:MAG: hypothetical protein ABI451_12560 [Dokdonella sp.]